MTEDTDCQGPLIDWELHNVLLDWSIEEYRKIWEALANEQRAGQVERGTTQD